MAADATVLIPPEEAADTTATPHLSFSRINRYLLCPEQYRLYYIENLRPKLESANLAFGALVHRALADMFQNGVDPVQDFHDAWAALKDAPLRFSRKDSWQSLAKQGEMLLAKFFEEEAGKLKNITSIEKIFEVDISSLELPFIGVIDLAAELRGKCTVIDFKTSQTKYAAHEVLLADQLTAYKLGEPAAEQVALCVFVKTKKPRIEWHMARRSDEQLLAYLEKAEYVGRQIQEGQFFLRPGKWCAQCDYLAICAGDQRKAQQTLTQIQVLPPQQR